MSNGCASPSPLAATVRILFLSTNSNRLPSGEKVGESPAPTLRGAPPAVATTHTSLGIVPSGEVLTLAGVSSSRLWPRVKAIDFASGDQASSPISKPSSSVYRVIWRAFAPWDGSATQMLLQPFALNTHATAAPVGAASMSDANGACITSLSVLAAGWVCAPASVAVIPSTAMPATATITLHANLFTLPPLPLLTGCSGVPTIPQVHYSHNDVAVFARFCYWLGEGFRSYFRRRPCSTIYTRS